MSSLRIASVTIKSDSNGEIIKVKVIPSTLFELYVSKSGKAVIKTNNCKTTPSNTLSMLSAYGLTVRCSKAIIEHVALSKYWILK